MNMGYCRFQNTLIDLLDCEQHIADEVSADEERARADLIEACERIVEDAAQ